MTRTRSLQADVFALARERASLAGVLPFADMPRLAASLLASDGELAYAVDGEVDDRGRPGAAMHLCATLPMECQRCGGRVDVALDRDARFRFVADEDELGTTPDDDDEIDVIVGSPRMDLVPWIEDEAILSLPLVPRHADGDPHCRPAAPLGAVAAAEEAANVRPNPFSVLAAIRPGSKPN